MRESPSNFEDVSWHFVMNLSEKKLLQTSFNVHGRDNQSFPTSLVPKKWLYLATTFSTPALRGLPHSSQNQKQIQITIWWWGEQACLLRVWASIGVKLTFALHRIDLDFLGLTRNRQSKTGSRLALDWPWIGVLALHWRLEMASGTIANRRQSLSICQSATNP